jgi:hypothetical protein
MTRHHVFLNPTVPFSWSLAAVLVLLAAGCASTSVLSLGRGQYLAVVDQSGGFPNEGALIEGARNAAAKQCGDLDHTHVIDVDASANRSYAGNHGHATVQFECVNPSVPPSGNRRIVERNRNGIPVFRD